MSSRGRVADALNFREPDGLPVDLGSTRSSGISAVTYQRLCEVLDKTEEQTRVFDVRQYLALVSPEIARWARSDVVPLYPLRPAAGLSIDRWKHHEMPFLSSCLVPDDYNPDRLEDGSNVLVDDQGTAYLRRAADGLYYEDINPPLAVVNGPKEFADAVRQHSPAAAAETASGSTPQDLETAWLASESARLNDTDSAVVLTTPISFFERGIKDFGYEEWLVRIMTDEATVGAYLEWLRERYQSLLSRWGEVITCRPEVVLVSDDLGTQQGPLIAPDTYRTVFKRHHTEIVGDIKRSFPHAKVLLHCCGSVRAFIPDLIEAGFDALNPIQIAADGMDPAELKAEFGRDIALWGGGINTQNTLSRGTAQEVRDEARRLIEVLSPGGGFVFAAVHNIQADVPAENVIALFETAAEYR